MFFFKKSDKTEKVCMNMKAISSSLTYCWAHVCPAPLHNTMQQCYDGLISSVPHAFTDCGSVIRGFAYFRSRLHE